MVKPQIVGGDKDHAEYSASGSERWLACPGSHELSKKAPEPSPSKYADEGTTAHECLEFLLKNRDLLGHDKLHAEACVLYTEEMVHHAWKAFGWILQEAQEAEILSETEVDTSSVIGVPGQFGTLDAAIIRPFDRLTVVDYKYGAGVVVDPEGEDGRGNPQLILYGHGLCEKYGFDFTEVELVVIQPRAFHPSGETIRTHVMTMDEFMAWRPIFKAGAAATKKKDAPLAAGSWCKFCRAAMLCPELKERSLAQAQIDFDDETGVVQFSHESLMPLPNLANILRAIPKLEAWIKVVEEHAQGVLERGGTIPGFKLVQKRAQRKWKNEAEVVRAWGDRAYAERKVLSPAQFEKSFKGSNAFVSANTTAESSGTTVVPESDKRPAVNSIEVDFAPENDPAFS